VSCVYWFLMNLPQQVCNIIICVHISAIQVYFALNSNYLQDGVIFLLLFNIFDLYSVCMLLLLVWFDLCRTAISVFVLFWPYWSAVLVNFDLITTLFCEWSIVCFQLTWILPKSGVWWMIILFVFLSVDDLPPLSVRVITKSLITQSVSILSISQLVSNSQPHSQLFYYTGKMLHVYFVYDNIEIDIKTII